MIHLAVISPEGDRADEFAVLGELLRLGLKRYHVRKPGWSEERLARWIETADPAWRPRLVIHSHHRLAEAFGVGGVHGPELGAGQAAPGLWRSRSCHSLPEVERAAREGACDSVFFSPVFASASKPGRKGFTGDEFARFAAWKRSRPAAALQVLALSGVTPERVTDCRRAGFDGVAVMGGIWNAVDPVRAFAAYRRAVLPPVMCLTQDGLELSHEEQARRLCGAGAKWVQLRMKGADEATWLRTARDFVAICRAHGAIGIVNDGVDIALAAGAAGVHLGAEDGDWRAARAALGPARILGGTVNDAAAARRAVAAGCLDYAGVGPLRFTSNKARLAPLLGVEGIGEVVAVMPGLPAWAIGGVEAGDVSDLLAAGAAGVAVSSCLYRGGTVEENYRRLEEAARESGVPAASDGEEAAERRCHGAALSS
ncbi:MAG TPA: thiamine phosphate synthase [Opitutaceae bacterium]|jgi:thiamine-phosphate pyrophosphorylase|nr:thiamine phosphate synthase [Opitutaceae bacterium]